MIEGAVESGGAGRGRVQVFAGVVGVVSLYNRSYIGHRSKMELSELVVPALMLRLSALLVCHCKDTCHGTSDHAALSCAPRTARVASDGWWTAQLALTYIFCWSYQTKRQYRPAERHSSITAPPSERERVVRISIMDRRLAWVLLALVSGGVVSV